VNRPVPTGAEADAIARDVLDRVARLNAKREPVTVSDTQSDTSTPPLTSESDNSDRGDRGTGVARSLPRISWTAAELMATDFPEPRWAVPGVLVEGVSLLVAAPKVGKSWLSLGVSIAVASGGKALSKVDVEQGDVLYLALEDTPRRLKRRLAAMLGHDKAPETLTLWTQCPPLPEGGDKRIRAWLDQHPDARLIVIDVLARVRGHAMPGRSAYDADYTAVARVKALADDHGVAVVLVHHDRKAEAADFLETVSGTNGLSGAADSILVLKRSRGEADAVLHITGRDVEETEVAMKFTAALGLWELLDGPAIHHILNHTRAAILRHVEAQPGVTPKQIADALNLKPNTARQTVIRMVEAGQLTTDGSGRYWAPPTGVTPVTPVTPAGQEGNGGVTPPVKLSLSTEDERLLGAHPDPVR
jgi:AAA domain/Winged helix-turn-helix DNA-binding